MRSRLAPLVLALLVLPACAGPAKLAQRSEEKLAGGEAGRAWHLATRALDKDPGNVRARAAASAAGNTMAREWEHRIHVLAQTDTVAAADQVLELATFRLNAVRYAAITVSPEWAREEQAYRGAAARVHYQRGVVALKSQRPKKAWIELWEAQRFVPDYRDVVALMDKAHARALTRVAVAPFSSSLKYRELGREVAAEWRDRLADHLMAPDAHFTRILGTAAVEQQMSLSQLGRLSRDEAMSMARRAGAERVLWGSIGEPESQTRLHLFTELIARKIVTKDEQGHTVTRWVDVPIEVVARVRTVTAEVDWELIAAKTGATLAHQRTQRSTSARAVWTSYMPEGDLGAYALVSDALRAADATRARQIETRWKETCGENVTLRQVLEERRSSRGGGRYQRDALPRFIAGAAFVFLQDLPPPEDLAFAALVGGWKQPHTDLLRLDEVDDIDLGMAAETERR